ncbi:uncharacterized protein LOC126615780 isoform X1 [Malus sylvestris]|uniref:uncharacterized protein LOC126615780 isoform X1 n=1 Tax=Malus sylvestris TaxID=3752 RepID=UPI0021AC2F05|nr:uncharacterized protein LOC126615780 isoform X1 [Malus sylvestris]
MQAFKKICLLHPVLLVLHFWLTTSISQNASTIICDKLNTQTPISKPNSTAFSRLNRIFVCKSQKLYHSDRTSINLFPISYTNYKCKSLIISNPSCSSPLQYAHPKLRSPSFRPPRQSNSLLLYNCSNKNLAPSIHFQNVICLPACGASSKIQEPKLDGLTLSSCILFHDRTKLDMGFHPRDLNCSCYSRVYETPSHGNNEGYGLKTRMSFDIPDHVPNICDECQKPNGNCGAGLRCVCHPKECKNKVISKGGSITSSGNILFSLLTLVVVMVLDH